MKRKVSAYPRKSRGVILEDTYVLDWVDDRGKRRRQNFKAKTQNEVTRAIVAKEMQIESGIDLSASTIRLKEFAREYIDWYEEKYPDSWERVNGIIEKHLIPFFGNYPLDQIKVREVDQYEMQRKRQKYRKKYPKQETINKEIRQLKAMLTQAARWEYIDYNPAQLFTYSGVHDSKPAFFFEKEQLMELYQRFPDRAHIWKFFANTGLRRAEYMNLENKWVGTDGMKIVSSQSNRTKSGKFRDVPLFEGARDALQAYSRKGKYLESHYTPTGISKMAKKDALRVAGQGSLHSFRHTFCSQLVMEGCSLRNVQLLAGHSKLEVTERYAHLSPEFLKDNVRLAI